MGGQHSVVLALRAPGEGGPAKKEGFGGVSGTSVVFMTLWSLSSRFPARGCSALKTS